MLSKPLLHDLRKHPLIAAAIPVLMCVAVYYRWIYRDFESGDMWAFVKPWIQFIRIYGLSEAYLHNFSNYMPLYTYMLGVGDWLMSSFDFSETIIAKNISLLGDLCMSFLAYRIVSLYRPDRNDLAWLTFFLLLASPTVFANSGILAQCDTWYTTFLLAALYGLMRHRYCQMLFWAGIAYSFKQQAMFLWPFFFIFVLNGKISWKWLWVAPAAILLTLVPAWLQGRYLYDMLMIYFSQANTYSHYGNAPNFYWLLGGYTNDGMIIGLMVTAIAGFSFSYVSSQRWHDHDNLLKFMLLATLSATMCPFIMPKMLDRYFYSADVLSLILAVMRPRWFMITLLLHTATIFAYPIWYYVITKPLFGIEEWYTSSAIIGSFFTCSALIIEAILCYRHIWKRDPVPLSISLYDNIRIWMSKRQKAKGV